MAACGNSPGNSIAPPRDAAHRPISIGVRRCIAALSANIGSLERRPATSASAAHGATGTRAAQGKGHDAMPDLPDPLDRRLTQVTPAETPGLRGLLTIAVAVVVIAGLYLGRSMLIPITLAVLLSFLLAPLVNRLRRMHFGRVPSVLLAVLLALAVIMALGGLIGTQVAGLAQEVPRYAVTIQQKIATVQQFMLSGMTRVASSFVHQAGPGAVTPNAKPGAAPTAAPSVRAQKPIPVEVHQPDLTAIEIARRVVTPVVDPALTTAIVLVVTIFILLQREDLRDRMIRLFGSSDLHRTTVAMNDAARRLSRYLLTQLAVNGAFGVIIATGLAVIGIPSPVMWGVLGALLRFVPYIGAPLSAVVPLALAAAIDPGWSRLLWTASLYLVVESVMGQAVEPLVYGRSTGLSPFAVVLAATFWSWLWGPIGLILSTPLTLCLVVVGRHVARLEFLDVLLGDRPALTPVESFYQRMLAGDPDEVHDHAEVLLKRLPLASYYDDIALEGLRLAILDTERGALSPDHLERIKLCIQSLIEDLDEHEDGQPLPVAARKAATIASLAEPDAPDPSVGDGPTPVRLELAPAWRGETPILCVAGRGLLDEAVSTMLAQLLGKQGLAARAVPHAATARSVIATLDVTGVKMVCISCLELSGTPSHLRYLLRRVRQRLPPDVPVLVGLWPDRQEILHDERLRAAVGADYYASSLHEAVEACLEVAHKASLTEQPPPMTATAVH
jgi:predicted PurR-regulated permease PerM